MKKYLLFAIVLICGGAAVLFWPSLTATFARLDELIWDREPDIPTMLQNGKSGFSKEEWLEKRAMAFAERRGLNNDRTPDPKLREAAVAEMDRQQDVMRRSAGLSDNGRLLASWTPIGPNPIVAGAARYSGRTIAIAVHPTNPDIVYVGTAQGGLYRSTNGGTTWTPLMDGAQSLAIGSIAIAPSNPEIVYVGTGEQSFSSDSFFGVGVYRINNASTTADISGPFNRDGSNADVMTGRSVAEICVHPTDPNTIFVATASGVGGIGGAANSTLPSRGVFRSTNAGGATPTFTRLTGLAGNLNASIRDIIIDPQNPNVLLAAVVAAATTGGVYRSADALAASPTFSQVIQYATGTSTSELTAEFAAVRPTGSSDATFYTATGNGGGRILRSTNGGVTWTQQIANNFCSPQCFYNIAIDVDPTNADRVYLGGAPALVAAFSANGGTSFTEGGSGVHVDTHVLAVAPSNPTIVYLGTDGGIYKSTTSGTSYTHLNTAQFYATQFMGISVHPTDANFTIGGTQDNGTNYLDPAASGWVRVDGGDGGYTVIDQNAADTTNVRMYHTYYNQINSVVGYATRANTSASWSFRGCNGTTPANGINCADTSVLFYAPLERGPGNPNTIYYGTDRIYRSADNGTTHTVVSQAPISSGVAVSAIGVSPQNDNVRIVGLRTGGLWGTTTGSSTLVDLDPSNQVTDGFIARAVIDPSNSNTAYVTVANFGVANVFKTTNLNASPPTWTNISGTIPQVPVSAFVVHPTNSNLLYAGTDIGVYVSTNAGASWAPFGTGLPRVAVFGMAITGANPRKLRIATHGKGMYEILADPAAGAKAAFDFDGDGKTDPSVYRPSNGVWYLSRSAQGFAAYQFGLSSDILTPEDFDGDNKTDLAVFRPSNGVWYVLRSSDFTFYGAGFGTTGDIPAPGDYDGDGRADTVVYRPSQGIWYLQRSTAGFSAIAFGVAEDKPAIGDFDGDGKADISVYRPSSGNWFRMNSSNNSFTAVQFGAAGDKIVPADYTGDGKTDIAVWRPSNGTWYIFRSEDQTVYGVSFGVNGDIPSPGDYDGDGRADQAVWRSGAQGYFYLNRSTAGFGAVPWGLADDKPIANAFVF